MPVAAVCPVPGDLLVRREGDPLAGFLSRQGGEVNERFESAVRVLGELAADEFQGCVLEEIDF